MKTATKVARLTLLGAGALLLVLGLIIWTGDADQVIPVHEVLGFVLVLSMWTIAAIAARSGVSIGLVALAAVWGLVALILGLAQEELLTGSWHWTIQVLHVVISMGVIAWGQQLVIFMRGNAAAGGPSPRLGRPAESAVQGKS
jgi:hypothetical protein